MCYIHIIPQLNFAWFIFLRRHLQNVRSQIYKLFSSEAFLIYDI